MNALHGLAWLLACQTAGELLSRGLGLPVPGPVVGMGLLVLALRWAAVRTSVGDTARFLLSHLSLLFVPVGVGVMVHLGLLQDHGWRVLVVLVASTWIGLAVTALVLRWTWRRAIAPASDHTPDKAHG
jgi:holin-like protein